MNAWKATVHLAYVGPDVEIERWSTARVAHECCACELGVRPGDRYHVYKQLFDGHWATLKHCERCWEIVELLSAHPETDAVHLRLNCGETWKSAFGEEPPEDVAALAFWLPGDPVPTNTDARSRELGGA